jgi:hypothetical protein
MLLIDTRNPPPERPAERPAWEPNWRLWAWVALTVVAGVAADAASGMGAYVLALVMLCCACGALAVVLPPLDGLRDYRQ